MEFSLLLYIAIQSIYIQAAELKASQITHHFRQFFTGYANTTTTPTEVGGGGEP